jgi:hypothetical protein
MSEIVMEGLIDSKLTRVIKTFLRDKDGLFHLKKISNHSKVPLTTTLAITKKLVGLDILEIVVIGKFKLYRLAKNKKTEFIDKVIR